EERMRMQPWSTDLKGRLDEHVFTSKALKGNALGDPHERPLWVYVPPGYDDSDARYPAIYEIQGLTGQLDMWRNRDAYRPSFLEMIDDQFARGDAPPAIVVLVDARSEEHTSELPSPDHLVCPLLPDKKKCTE